MQFSRSASTCICYFIVMFYITGTKLTNTQTSKDVAGVTSYILNFIPVGAFVDFDCTQRNLGSLLRICDSIKSWKCPKCHTADLHVYILSFYVNILFGCCPSMTAVLYLLANASLSAAIADVLHQIKFTPGDA